MDCKPIVIIDTQEPYSFAQTPKFTSVQIVEVVKQQKGKLSSVKKQKRQNSTLKKDELNGHNLKGTNRQQSKDKKMLQKYLKLMINSHPQHSFIKETQSVRSIHSNTSKKSTKNNIQFNNSLNSNKNLKSYLSNQHLNQKMSPQSIIIKAKDFSSRFLSKSMRVQQKIQQSPLQKKYDFSIAKPSQTITRFNLQPTSKNKILNSPSNNEANHSKKILPSSINLFYSERKNIDIRDKGKSFQSILNKAKPKLTFKTRVFHTSNLQEQSHSQMQGSFFQY